MVTRYLACAALVVGCGLARGVQAAEADVAGVTQAVADFHVALDQLFKGEAASMKAIWSHADDIAYMGPMGEQEIGWEAIAPIWETQASLKLGGKVGVDRLHVIAGPELGVASYYEIGENVVNGTIEAVSIRCTTSFRKEQGQWKVIGHHTDLLPFLVH